MKGEGLNSPVLNLSAFIVFGQSHNDLAWVRNKRPRKLEFAYLLADLMNRSLRVSSPA